MTAHLLVIVATLLLHCRHKTVVITLVSFPAFYHVPSTDCLQYISILQVIGAGDKVKG